MKAFGQRLLRLVVVVAVVTFFTFLLLDNAPGDPAVTRAGLNATPEVLEETREEMGLNDPFLVRYGNWVSGAVQGDLGESYRTPDVTAWSLMKNALPKTLLLMVMAQIIALAIAIPAAVTSARRPGGWLDRILSAVAFGLLALPAFVLGVYMSYVFAVRWNLLPTVATDLPSLFSDPVENLRQLILPALTLAFGLIAVYLRLLRGDLIATLQEDFVLLAQARGFTDRRVLWRQAFRPSSLSLLTAVGLNTGALIGGALIIEILFAIPGMGRLTVTSIFSEDYVVVQAAVLLFTIGYVFINFAVDVLYIIVDPRIRHESR